LGFALSLYWDVNGIQCSFKEFGILFLFSELIIRIYLDYYIILN